MDCNDCDMHDLCIPVPGMPGQCTLPATCEQCINERMDVIEHESALLDADVAAMRKDIDALQVKVRVTSRKIAGQSRQVAMIKQKADKVIEASTTMLERATRDLGISSETSNGVERLQKLLERIKAAVLYR